MSECSLPGPLLVLQSLTKRAAFVAAEWLVVRGRIGNGLLLPVPVPCPVRMPVRMKRVGSTGCREGTAAPVTA